ncbi:hypothetical protein [Halalkalirubrum salinum]|uniref:hypothetical protein n=1 Tax=Halalkalirubrum salinum TaxID=2563889 RepID=UPI0010FBB490|nr:hypothetical protein [Halalkalirubrum salinum]
MIGANGLVRSARMGWSDRRERAGPIGANGRVKFLAPVCTYMYAIGDRTDETQFSRDSRAEEGSIGR